MNARYKAWLPRYLADEVALGLALAVAVHGAPIAFLLYRAAHPAEAVQEEPFVARPAVAATLLKLGKPIDPRKLPDRLVPQARTAPKQEVTASREEPQKPKEKPDAGPPPEKTEDSDLENLIAKTETFAEKGAKPRAEEGHPDGVKEGTETDPSKVRAGDMYAAQLAAFFRERWQIPTVISQGELNRLCVVFQISIGPRLAVWNVKPQPLKSSGNELFDDSAKSMFDKLVDDHTPLPTPPDEILDQFRGRTRSIALQGNPHGDGSACR